MNQSWSPKKKRRSYMYKVSTVFCPSLRVITIGSQVWRIHWWIRGSERKPSAETINAYFSHRVHFCTNLPPGYVNKAKNMVFIWAVLQKSSKSCHVLLCFQSFYVHDGDYREERWWRFTFCSLCNTTSCSVSLAFHLLINVQYFINSSGPRRHPSGTTQTVLSHRILSTI